MSFQVYYAYYIIGLVKKQESAKLPKNIAVLYTITKKNYNIIIFFTNKSVKIYTSCFYKTYYNISKGIYIFIT